MCVRMWYTLKMWKQKPANCQIIGVSEYPDGWLAFGDSGGACMADKCEKDKTDHHNKRYNDTKTGLILRIMLAFYVLYLAYGLAKDFGEISGNEKILIGAAIVIFVAAGGAILFFSAKKLIRKEYKDADEGEEDTEDAKDEEER